MTIRIIRARWLDWRWVGVLTDRGEPVSSSVPSFDARVVVQWAARQPVTAMLDVAREDMAELLRAERELRALG